MLDIGWSELLLIGVVALIVVGPKDLPVMFHTLGRLTAKARQMAREFSRAMEDAAKETGLDAAADDIKGLASKKSLGLEALERATEKFEKWDPKFPAATAAKDEAPVLKADPNEPDVAASAQIAPPSMKVSAPGPVAGPAPETAPVSTSAPEAAAVPAKKDEA